MSNISSYFRFSYYRRILGPTFWILTASILVNDTLYETISVEGQSMAPSLSPSYHETGAKDYIVTRKYLPTADLKRGDVVTFWSPVKPDKLVCKRITGLEGDVVTLDRKRRPEDEMQARNWDVMALAEGDEKGTVRVPWGHVWVEGDNWRKSADSNNYGPISKSLITGKALFVLLPFSKFLDTPWTRVQNKTKVEHGQRATPVEWEDL